MTKISDNLYDILGVDKNATPEDIKNNYREKAKESHPDKPGGGTEKMQALSKAYNILSDPKKRKVYDSNGQTDKDPRAMELTEILIGIFRKALADAEDYVYTDIIRKCKGVAYENITNQRKSIKGAKESLKLIKVVLKRLSVKKGVPNILQAELESEIHSIEGNIITMEDRLSLLSEVHKMFDAYTYKVDTKETSTNTDITDVFARLGINFNPQSHG